MTQSDFYSNANIIHYSPNETVYDINLKLVFGVETKLDSLSALEHRHIGNTIIDCDITQTVPNLFPFKIKNNYSNFVFFQSSVEGFLWRAERNKDQSQVILKIYHSGISKETSLRDTLIRLKHSNIVSLIDYEKTKTHLYEVMTYISGSNLQKILNISAFSELASLFLLKNMIHALEELHSYRIVHNDIKPENILQCKDDNQWKLCDFGIAQIIPQEIDHIQRIGQTPQYAAPEVLNGSVYKKSDFWALGKTLFYALTKHTTCHTQYSGYKNFSYDWKKLLDGLLEKDCDKRWGLEQVHAWIDQSNEVSKDNYQYETLESLAQDIMLHWQEMSLLVQRGEFAQWLHEHLGENPILETLLLPQGDVHPDIYILRIILKLSPNITPVWKQWVITPKNLEIIAKKALNGNQEFSDLLKEIYTLNVLKEICISQENERIEEIQKTWHDAIDGYFSAKEWVLHYSQTIEFEDAKNIAILYLGYEKQFKSSQWKAINNMCYPWIEYLMKQAKTNRGYFLVKEFVKKQLEPTLIEHLRVFQGVPLEGIECVQRFHLFRRAPVISARAIPIPVYYQIGERQITVGRRVRIMWEITGASWCYLHDIGGKIPSQGWIEFFIGKTTQFSFHALSWIGYTHVTLNIEVEDKPELEEPIALEIYNELNPISSINLDITTPTLNKLFLESTYIQQEKLDNTIQLNRENIKLHKYYQGERE